MHNRAWMQLLRLIPADRQKTLLLNTTNGTEIAIHSIIRAEEDFMLIRGRLTGTTDGGGIFVLPFANINYLGFQKDVNEAEVRAMLGIPAEETTSPKTLDQAAADAANADLVRTESPANVPQPAASVSTSAPTPVPGRLQSLRKGEGNGVAGKAAGVDKASLLERLRTQRIGERPRNTGP